jgi:hypothetical protein
VQPGIPTERGHLDRPLGVGENLRPRARRRNGVEFRILVRIGPVVIAAGVYTVAVIRRVHE